MEYAAILALIQKGLTVIEAVVAAGQTAAPAFRALADLISGAQQGSVTDEQMAQTEALLDQLIADFNIEME